MKNSFNIPFDKLLEEADIMALKALAAGNANDRQQKIALNAVFNKICRTGRLGYCEESSRNTDFNQGVRYVGIQINSAIGCDLNALKKNSQSKKTNPSNN